MMVQPGQDWNGGIRAHPRLATGKTRSAIDVCLRKRRFVLVRMGERSSDRLSWIADTASEPYAHAEKCGPLLTKSASDQLWLEVLGKESPATGVPDAGLW